MNDFYTIISDIFYAKTGKGIRSPMPASRLVIGRDARMHFIGPPYPIFHF